MGLMLSEYKYNQDPAIKVCGIFLCYNEEHILHDSLTYYLSQGLDIVFFDNESTDSSLDIVHSIQNSSQNTHFGSIIDVVTIRTQGFEWEKILVECSNYMHAFLSAYDWIVIIDADSFYCSPVQNLNLLDLIKEADHRGYNVLKGVFYNFYPTTSDPENETSIRCVMKHYDAYDKNHNSVYQEKIFAYHPSVDFVSLKAHRIKRKDKKVFPIFFHFKHYGWTSFEQGKRKIFKERKQRYIAKELRATHPPYNALLPIESDFIRNAEDLVLFKASKECISKMSFRLSLLVLPIHAILKRLDQRRRERFEKKWQLFKSFKNIEILRAFLDFWKLSRREQKNRAKWSKKFPKLFPNNDRSWACGPVDIVNYAQQKIDAAGAPFSPFIYHFLVSGACNARCTFCNQHHYPNQQLTIEQFKTITGNIPREAMRTFIFSGGGEPLLCNDLEKMIAYTKKEFPWVSIGIRTNGFSLREHIDTFSTYPINFIEISWHTADEAETKKIYRCGGYLERIQAVRELQCKLKLKQCKTEIRFCMVASQMNIDSLPEIIQCAARLSVREVQVSFCKYYTLKKHDQEQSGKPAQFKQSLFFAQNKYDAIIRKSRKIAKKENVKLVHDPLFNKGHFMKIHCRYPWTTMLIDYNGQVFPCPGGEIQFGNQVREGKYYFGNLLRQHLYECLSELSYTQIRRTAIGSTKENFMPECGSCCMTTQFSGINQKRSHLIGDEARLCG